jgi:hypothetical protein
MGFARLKLPLAVRLGKPRRHFTGKPGMGDRFNHHRMLGAIGHRPPAEAAANDDRQLARKKDAEVSN